MSAASIKIKNILKFENVPCITILFAAKKGQRIVSIATNVIKHEYFDLQIFHRKPYKITLVDVKYVSV